MTKPVLRDVNVGTRCDPSRIVAAVHADLAASLELPRRVFRDHGRTYIAGRLLAPDDVDVLLDALDDPEIGLHLDQLGYPPGLDAWLGWAGMRRIRHLSFHEGVLRRAGLEALVATGNVEQLRSLDLSSCDIGTKGLELLRTTDAMPSLEELYLGANTDYDKTKWNDKAVRALLIPTKTRPLGKSLANLRVLSLDAWTLTDAIETLASSSVMLGLEQLELRHVHELVRGRPTCSAPGIVAALADAGAKLHTLALAGEITGRWIEPTRPLPLRTLHTRHVPLDRLADAWFWNSLEQLSVQAAALAKPAVTLPPRLKQLAIGGFSYDPKTKQPEIPAGFLANLAENPVVRQLESLTFEGYPLGFPESDSAWPEVIRRAIGQPE